MDAETIKVIAALGGFVLIFGAGGKYFLGWLEKRDEAAAKRAEQERKDHREDMGTLNEKYDTTVTQNTTALTVMTETINANTITQKDLSDYLKQQNGGGSD